ncbi:MAG TPA: amino acid adenylation domain-containing protein [Kofleriaceae bacterium]|nr:amino acid adenylation domain-containing protein [Kofleriaceae bacterium]
MDIFAMIDAHAARAPSALVFISSAGRLTWGELDARANALAGHLHRTLVRGSAVVVRGQKEPGMLIALLACARAGMAFVPIDEALPMARQALIVRRSRAPLILEAAALPAVENSEPAPAAARLTRDDIVYIMFTSGSSGEPKGVPITFGNLQGFLDWACEVHPIRGGKRFLDQAPYSFDLSVLDTWGALVTGGSLFAVDRATVANPLLLAPALAAGGIEVWVSTPSFAELCLGDRRFDAAILPRLSCFLFCGEPLTPATALRVKQRFPAARIYNLYGPTEATVAVTSALIADHHLSRDAPLPLGTPLPGTRVFVANDAGDPVPDGESGELVIEGPCVSPGYLDAPELTARSFSGHAPRRHYRTGDAGRVVDGELRFEGRLDGQIKLFGHRIELDDIAANLTALPNVARGVVIAVEEGGRAVALVGFVVGAPGARLDPRQLRDELATRVPSYMVPREIRVVDALPMTVNGKLDRRSLAELSRQRP